MINMDIHEKSQAKEVPEGVRVKIVHHCARCGLTHEHMIFNKFTNPVIDTDDVTWDYWALCPTLNEPILMYRGSDDNESD